MVSKNQKLNHEKLEHLSEMFRLIQTDPGELTAKERTEFLIKASVFGANYQVFAFLLHDLTTTREDVKSQELAKKTKLLWEDLSDKLHLLRGFIKWLAENIGQSHIFEFSVQKTLGYTDRHGFYTGESPLNELFMVKAFKPPKGGLGKHLGVGNYTPEEYVGEFTAGPEFLELAKALDGVPLDRIKHCEYEKCRRVFVQATGRKKKYCCQRCQNTMGVRAKRARLKERQKKEG